MNPTNLNSNHSSDRPWPVILNHWLGHLWSFCSQNLHRMIKRIYQIALSQFSSDAKQPEAGPLKVKVTVLSNTPFLALHTKTGREKQMTQHVQSISLEKLLALPIEKVAVKLEEELPVEVDDSRQSEGKTHAKPLPIQAEPEEDPVLDDMSPAKETDIAQSEESAAASQPKRVLKRRNRRKKNPFIPKPLDPSTLTVQPLPDNPLQHASNSQPTPPASPKLKIETKQLVASARKKAKIIECGGGGDCQLLSFAKGLELLHPKLTRPSYTASTLRQMGVQFVRKQIDSCSPYTETLLGYLDADRKEYNESQVDPVKKQFLKEQEKLETALKDKKIAQDGYDKQKTLLLQAYEKKMNYLEKNVVIQTDEQFLNCLEQKGFYCSTLHLYAFSILFKVPILVHDKEGASGHHIQTFNPTKSKLDPLNLLRVKGKHYQLLVYPA